LVDPGPARLQADRTRLEVRGLTGDDVALVASFSCGADEDDADLNEWLRDDAFRLQEHHTVSTYLAIYDGALVGYVSILCDVVKLKTGERKKLALTHADHPMIPALKIAKLAVCETFRKTHRGMGELLVRFAFLTAQDLGERTGCRLLTLDAYPKSEAFYAKLGFVRNEEKEYDGRRNASMRLDVFAKSQPAWV
jgi:GNAT superfamily N-acetyltransferase